MVAEASWELVEGATSDIAFVAYGADLGAAFVAASEALLAVTVADPSAVRARERRAVELTEPDLELLLLSFLNELVFLRDAHGLLLRGGELEVTPPGPAGGEARLAGFLLGEPVEPGRQALVGLFKAVTAHGLRVEPHADGWRVQVTLDV